ncbi:Hypothetical predicted protein [Podarcis lilfordi]|uniref:Uncharacterized protein n=1 Tax=Podarcis lilfordi TaxID=74358 RepID=A0AA35L2F1_9SAUR|nr:Hypothetical predicted protein [Podarcis lilfordi]
MERRIDLILAIVDNLKALNELYTKMAICWPELLEARHWWHILKLAKITKARKVVNSAVVHRIEATGRRVIWHPDITFDKDVLFRHDGVHLSGMGNVSNALKISLRALGPGCRCRGFCNQPSLT